MENNEHNQEVVNMGYEEVEEWDRQQWKNEMQRKTIECLTERRFVFSIFFDTYTGVAIIKKNWKGMDAWNEWVDKYRNKYSAIVRGWNDIISVETRYSVYVYRIAFFFSFSFSFFPLQELSPVKMSTIGFVLQSVLDLHCQYSLCTRNEVLTLYKTIDNETGTIMDKNTSWYNIFLWRMLHITFTSRSRRRIRTHVTCQNQHHRLWESDCIHSFRLYIFILVSL